MAHRFRGIAAGLRPIAVGDGCRQHHRQRRGGRIDRGVILGHENRDALAEYGCLGARFLEDAAAAHRQGSDDQHGNSGLGPNHFRFHSY